MNSSDAKFASIDEYIKAASKDVQPKLRSLRKFINSISPSFTETISYGMPTFKLNGKAVVYFAAFKNHIGFFPFPSGISAFKAETAEYKTSKGTIQFPLTAELPWNLIKRIVEFRVGEVMSKEKSVY